MTVTEKIKLYTLFELMGKGIITLKQAAEQLGMTVENFEKEAKYLDLL